MRQGELAKSLIVLRSGSVSVLVNGQHVGSCGPGSLIVAFDKDTGQELVECNRRLGDLREAVAVFLSQSAGDHVYWVERTGKAQKNLTLNAAPIDVADYLRRRLFGSETSVTLTSATLAISARTRQRDRASPFTPA